MSNEKPISLVTGGAGFIGSNLCKHLLKLNHTVICLDNLSTGSEENIREFYNNSNFIFKQADVTTMINEQSFPILDYIWHLACPASPPKYQADGYKTLQTCLLGTMNVLELVRTHNCPLLFSSTSEVYGDPSEHPQRETYFGNVNTVGPRSCYDEGKRASESLIYEFRKKVPQTQLKIVRIFNTYGPNMDIDDGRVITNFIKSIKNEQPLTIYGNGSQTRSFCYVDDMVDGLMKMMWSDETGPVNLGNPDCEFTLNELKTVFETILGKKLDVETFDLPQNDPQQRKPDITLATERLGWKPEVELETGLRNLLNYYKVRL